MKHGKTIEKKLLPEYFKAVKARLKTFELRRDDSDYEVGDILKLREWNGKEYTGNVLYRQITYILRDCPDYGLQSGFCILALEETSLPDPASPRLLTAEEVQNLKDRDTICVEQLFSREDEERGYITAKGWGVVCNSTGSEDGGLIISILGTFAPNYVNRIPFRALQKRDKGKDAIIQFRFWSDKPTVDQSKAIKWDET